MKDFENISAGNTYLADRLIGSFRYQNHRDPISLLMNPEVVIRDNNRAWDTDQVDEKGQKGQWKIVGPSDLKSREGEALGWIRRDYELPNAVSK